MGKVVKFIFRIFSLIVLALVIMKLMLMYNLFSGEIKNGINYVIDFKFDNALYNNILISILSFIGLLSFVIIFSKDKKEVAQDGILLENSNGKLLISRETLQNLVKDLAKNIPGTENAVSSIVIDKNNKLLVIVDISMKKDVSIKDVTKLLQEDVKKFIKATSDLEVSEVNVNVVNISNSVMSDEEKENFEKLLNDKNESIINDLTLDTINENESKSKSENEVEETVKSEKSNLEEEK